MNLYLTGYRGTGKTTVGRLVAEALEMKPVDLDDSIEQRAGKSIAQLFTEQGEEAFRDLESLECERLSHETGLVVSLGGGAILRQSNRNLINASGRVVWLRASEEVLADRLTNDPSSESRRPALTRRQNQLEEIREVLTLREPLYREVADKSFETESLTPSELANQIATWWQE